jgi:AcrR family transcriptional regulator
MDTIIESKKYSAILDSARKLFWKHGFRRVTIDEICQDAKCSKMTFYRFFRNKTDLAKKVLEIFLDENLKIYRDIMSDRTSVSDKLGKLIQMKYEGSRDLSFDFMQDFLFSTDLDLAEFYQKKMNEIVAESILHFRKGQEEGWIRKDLNVEFLFSFSQNIMVFLKDEKLLGLFDSPKDLINELTKLLVYGIAPIE